jgi:hypothetical protein
VAVPAPVATSTSSLRARVATLRDEHAELWASTPDDLPILGPATGFFRHWSNARAAARLIDDLSDEGSRPPAEDDARRAWQESVRTRLHTFGAERLGWPEGYRRLMFGDAFFTAAGDFSRAARAFDPDLKLDDLWQALRNIWIGNGLQMLLDLPVQSTPALFAYSMLYPVTDNLLDDRSVAAADKRRFNDRFGQRLAGCELTPSTAVESAAFALVATIERQFPRHRYPDVHESLLAIHHGQVLSLTQQQACRTGAAAARGSGPREDDEGLLAISCEKGGTSVLADLYLIAGEACEDAERFAFGYGVALQLMDDLQDATIDAAAGHQTLFTRAAARGPLDAIAARLLQFIDRAIDAGRQLPRARAPRYGEASPERRASYVVQAGHEDRLDLLRRNCRSLVVGSMAEQPALFTGGFRRQVARHWPLSLGGIRHLRTRARRRLPSERVIALLARPAH